MVVGPGKECGRVGREGGRDGNIYIQFHNAMSSPARGEWKGWAEDLGERGK